MRVKLIWLGAIVPLVLCGNNIRVSQVELESGGPSYVLSLIHISEPTRPY